MKGPGKKGAVHGPLSVFLGLSLGALLGHYLGSTYGTSQYGAQTTDGVVEFNGKHLIVGSNDIYIFSGNPGNITSIADAKVRDYFYKHLNNAKANKLFNEIGNNTLNNEKTSVGIIEHYTTLNLENKFKVGTYSIYTALGVKNNAGIMSELRGQDTLVKLQARKKVIVDKLILPIADLKNLVESNEKKTNLEKKKTKAENKTNVESDAVANKSDEKIKANAIRTTANDITYPILLLCSLDKSNFKFKKFRCECYCYQPSNG